MNYIDIYIYIFITVTVWEHPLMTSDFFWGGGGGEKQKWAKSDKGGR